MWSLTEREYVEKRSEMHVNFLMVKYLVRVLIIILWWRCVPSQLRNFYHMERVQQTGDLSKEAGRFFRPKFAFFLGLSHGDRHYMHGCSINGVVEV